MGSGDIRAMAKPIAGKVVIGLVLIMHIAAAQTLQRAALQQEIAPPHR
jgi:hypothetical protein